MAALAVLAPAARLTLESNGVRFTELEGAEEPAHVAQVALRGGGEVTLVHFHSHPESPLELHADNAPLELVDAFVAERGLWPGDVLWRAEAQATRPPSARSR